MVPAQCGGCIAPGYIGAERTAAVPEIKNVFSKITAQVKPVFFRNLVILIKLKPSTQWVYTSSLSGGLYVSNIMTMKF